MFLHEVLSTAYTRTAATAALCPLLNIRRHSSLIPYCRVVLLLSMIPLVRSEVSVPSSVLTSLRHSLTANAVVSSSTEPTTTATSNLNTSQENSCYNTSICEQVFASAIYRINVTDSYAYRQMQCNYSLFENLLIKYDCNFRPESSKPLLWSDYSYGVTCQTCKEYYRQWLCAAVIHYTATDGVTYPPCESVLCHRVKRACPYIHPVEETYSSEPSFICNDVADSGPCYYFSTENSRDNQLLAGYQTRCNHTGSNDTVCILESSASSLHQHFSITTLAFTVLLMSLHTLVS
ncbi:uncharacterized protein [Watersipora subatra]|uniref:uncharacterized protein n=1 Tax=Watersipora subatra TaxID=2589382 RepID=UPI00355AFE2C